MQVLADAPAAPENNAVMMRMSGGESFSEDGVNVKRGTESVKTDVPDYGPDEAIELMHGEDDLERGDATDARGPN